MTESTGKNKVEWYDECVALQQDGDLAAAISELKKLAKAYPDYGLARLALGAFLLERGDEDEALEEMKKACELEQDDPFYFTAMSAVAVKCGNHEHAEAALMQAQEMRLAAQIRKMKELRDKEVAKRKDDDAEAKKSEPSDADSDAT
ncbi:MAG: tetratricopeptide repeat protein [Thermoguttaceae bacterium]|jgi:tetratricopeptide (TPR) repeat protein